jgi:glutaminase
VFGPCHGARLGDDGRETRNYRPGERIIAQEDPSDSVFFLEQGMVSVKLVDGVRLATLVPGMAFGEPELIAFSRTADVWADNAVRCQRISRDVFNEFRNRHPAARTYHAKSRASSRTAP